MMKKILLIGFIIVLLVAIPVTVFLVQQQQKTKSAAQAATIISILPASQAPIGVGDVVTLNVQVNPANVNMVSLVKFTIKYDETKIATEGAGFVLNTTTNHLTPIQGPTYGAGTISMTLSAGGNPQAVIQQATDIGTITFRALATTDAAPTRITFGTDTQVLSLGTVDQFNENVLSSANPAVLTIIGGTPTTPTVTAGPTPTTGPTPTANAPVCSSLVADPTSGTAPLTTNLTVTGSSNNSTINKVTFTFGDGQSQDITSAGGIGTNSVSVLQSHVYNTAGTFNATAVLTDATDAVSSTANCSVTITVNATGSAIQQPPAQQAIVVTSTPTPTPVVIQQPSPLPPTGPTQIVQIGTIGAIAIIIGALLLFAL